MVSFCHFKCNILAPWTNGHFTDSNQGQIKIPRKIDLLLDFSSVDILDANILLEFFFYICLHKLVITKGWAI